MQTKYKVIIGIVACCGCYALGRYTTPEKVVTKTVTVEKSTDETDTIKDVIKETSTTVTKKPDGTVITTTETKDETNNDIDRKTTNEKDKSSFTETTSKSGFLNVSALAGVSTQKPINYQSPFVYGISVNRNLLGPVTIGAWGLTNLTFGVSVGLNF